MPYNDSLPGPGVYSIKAYTVLSNGSYVDSLYTGLTELKNEGRLNVYSNTAIFPLYCIFCVTNVLSSLETPTKATMSKQAGMMLFMILHVMLLLYVVVLHAIIV